MLDIMCKLIRCNRMQSGCLQTRPRTSKGRGVDKSLRACLQTATEPTGEKQAELDNLQTAIEMTSWTVASNQQEQKIHQHLQTIQEKQSFVPKW